MIRFLGLPRAHSSLLKAPLLVRALSTPCSTPVRFDAFALEPVLHSRIQYEHCTPIQAQSMLEILAGRDVLGQARTGEGKTAAFLIPIIQQLLEQKTPRGSGISTLIVAPSRELAIQIQVAAENLAPSLKSVVVVGATNVSRDVRALQGGADILVGTPGRLNDLIENYGLAKPLASIKHCVLDECDTLLDAGFLVPIQTILGALPDRRIKPRQTVLFSATVSPRLQKVIDVALLPDPVHISTIDPNTKNTHDRVPQHVSVVEWDSIYAAALHLIKREQRKTPESAKIMVFLPTARGAAALQDAMQHLLFPTFAVHSRMSQPARLKATESFRNAKTGILFSSDVVARGIDLPDVSLVLQIGHPRAGKSGAGHLILNEDETSFLAIREIAALPIQTIALPSLKEERAALENAFKRVSSVVKEKAYSAHLGYYKSFIKPPSHLVATSTAYALQTLCYRDPRAPGQPPAIQKMTVGKMGLKGVPGIRIDPMVAERPPRIQSKAKPRVQAF